MSVSVKMGFLVFIKLCVAMFMVMLQPEIVVESDHSYRAVLLQKHVSAKFVFHITWPSIMLPILLSSIALFGFFTDTAELEGFIPMCTINLLVRSAKRYNYKYCWLFVIPYLSTFFWTHIKSFYSLLVLINNEENSSYDYFLHVIILMQVLSVALLYIGTEILLLAHCSQATMECTNTANKQWEQHRQEVAKETLNSPFSYFTAQSQAPQETKRNN